VPAVHLVVPDGVNDPARPSGGNEYDRRISVGLRTAGWEVCGHEVAGGWPHPDPAARQDLSRLLADLPDGTPALVDGLIASAAPSVLVAAARRLRLVVLVHMLFGDTGANRTADGAATAEGTVLEAAAAIITTSRWARDRLIALYSIPPERVHAAPPGATPAAPARPTARGSRLLCVGVVAPHKGQQVLLTALAELADQNWTCDLVGAEEADFVGRLRDHAAGRGVAGRLRFHGPLTGAALGRAYADADLLVHPSLGETYGMVVTEALARGLPVIGSAAGGVAEALGNTEHGRPGALVPPGDPAALATAVRNWLTDPATRQRWRLAAAARRTTLDGWDVTCERIAAVLTAAGATQ
jgi:glycosyltransferase involved in cell wall biosynthesis